MAKPNADFDDQVLMTNESPLARAEASRYVEHQKAADFNRNMSQYMFWGATSLMAAVVGMTLGMFTAPAWIGGSVVAGVVGAGLSALTFLGSVRYSRKATEISERSNVLYSDIDSQNQARRMVQAFARAQAPSIPETATAAPARSWTDRVGGPAQRSIAPAADRSADWQSRIVAQADREDAQALQQLR